MDCNLSFHGFQCRNLCSCIANRFLRQCWQFCWYLVTQSCIQGLLFELDSHSQFCALSSSAQVHRLFQFLQKSHSCEKKKSSFNFVGSLFQFAHFTTNCLIEQVHAFFVLLLTNSFFVSLISSEKMWNPFFRWSNQFWMSLVWNADRSCKMQICKTHMCKMKICKM